MNNTELINRINELKNKRNAIILAHNYQNVEVQDIADITGDSLELSRKASQTKADVIVFCGVSFMAETAAILSPEKKVLLPDTNAGCPLANMINAEDVIALRKKYPNAPVVSYVNTSAAVKAETDIACTSANAIKVVGSLKGKEIIFIPDKYLGTYVQSKTPDKKLILWEGYCPTHLKILPEHILELKNKYPDAKVIVHPECRTEVANLADAALSTSGMIKYAKESNAKTFIVGTEIGLLHKLKKENPEKTFLPASNLAVCPNMKLITLEKILWSLEEMKPEVLIPKDIREKALNSVNRMIEIVA
ncbi:MAG: quinolinate synthase [Elusimicrobia bacterium RIFOXYA2_FULL_39_19]|nr:MAG: quinolinate synthase [Elusimicrobia bacterium RIFOXYA2_FULL_39_19]